MFPNEYRFLLVKLRISVHLRMLHANDVYLTLSLKAEIKRGKKYARVDETSRYARHDEELFSWGQYIL